MGWSCTLPARSEVTTTFGRVASGTRARFPRAVLIVARRSSPAPAASARSIAASICGSQNPERMKSPDSPARARSGVLACLGPAGLEHVPLTGADRVRAVQLIHTCYRITDPQRSVAFYEALGLEKRREMPIRDEAINIFMGVPGEELPELELTHNYGVDKLRAGHRLRSRGTHGRRPGRHPRASQADGDRAREAPLSNPRGRFAPLLRQGPRRLQSRAARAGGLKARPCGDLRKQDSGANRIHPWYQPWYRTERT